MEHLIFQIQNSENTGIVGIYIQKYKLFFHDTVTLKMVDLSLVNNFPKFISM